jgi:anti-sigma regulatory factor (Ser/Thr protein kinase)
VGSPACMRLRLFPTVNAPGEARRALDGPFGTAVDKDSLSDLRTVVNELMTICVEHGASEPIDICVELVDGHVEGRVNDHGPGVRAMARAREEGDGSFVLRIIDAFVDDWRVTKEGVWFRMGVRPLGST